MKKILYTLFSLVLFTSNLMAKKGINQDALYIQLSGVSCDFLCNYDHCFWNRPVKDTNKFACSANMTIGFGVTKFMAWNLTEIIPVGVNYVIGGRKWSTEIGAGVNSYFPNRVVVTTSEIGIRIKDSFPNEIVPVITSEIGLRYKPVKNNLIFKFLCTPYWYLHGKEGNRYLYGNEVAVTFGLAAGIVL